MTCDCHLCKKKDAKAYWIMDMKFCEECYRAIINGDLERLKNE